MNSREKEVLNRAVEVLKKHLAPSRIYLFGSRAMGRNHRNADFDLAVDSYKPGIRAERCISEEIEQFSGLYHVDIVYLPAVDEGFRTVILSTGKLIYEKTN